MRSVTIILAMTLVAGCSVLQVEKRAPSLTYVGESIGRPASSFDFGNVRYSTDKMFVYRVEIPGFFDPKELEWDVAARVSLCENESYIGQEAPLFSGNVELSDVDGRFLEGLILLYIDEKMHTYRSDDPEGLVPVPFARLAPNGEVCVQIRNGGRLTRSTVIQPWR